MKKDNINQLKLMQYAPHTFKLFLNKLIKTNLKNWEEISLDEMEEWLEIYILENIDKEPKLQQNIEYLNIYGVNHCFENINISYFDTYIEVDILKNNTIELGFEIPNYYEISEFPTPYFVDNQFYKVCVPENDYAIIGKNNYHLQWLGLLFIINLFRQEGNNMIINLNINNFKLSIKDINKLKIIFKNSVIKINN